MICPECNKFTSFDDPEVEVHSVEIDVGKLTANLRIVLKCADCSTELKDADVSVTTTFTHLCSNEQAVAAPDSTCKPDVVSCGEGGKAHTLMRERTVFYGFALDSELKCPHCSGSFTVLTRGDVAASEFNELV